MVDLKYIPRQECLKENDRGYLKEGVFCTVAKEGKDTCDVRMKTSPNAVPISQYRYGLFQGDSGGPALWKETNGKKSFYVQVGLVQGGSVMCGVPESVPAIFTDTRYHLDWIKKTAEELGGWTPYKDYNC